MAIKRKPLTREQVIAAVERKSGANVPMVFATWWGEGLHEQHGGALNEIARDYPADAFQAWYQEPGETDSPNGNPEYRFGYKDYINAERHSIGKTAVLLDDFDECGLFLEHFPDPREPSTFDRVKESLKDAGNQYKLGCFWRVFHEKLWTFLGMENLMIAYYEEMDNLKLIVRKLVDYYKVIVDRYAELGFDGIFTSDDLGHQTGPMMSPAIFKELYAGAYKELVGYVHSKGMHFWLHSCGDNTLLLPYLIEAGVDVFHPIQKGTMDLAETFRLYGGKISWLYGVDVQHLLVEATPEEVAAEIREVASLLNQNGGLLMGAGNGIMGGTPLANIRAMLETVSSLSEG